MSGESIRDVLAEIEQGMTMTDGNGVKVLGAEWTSDPGLLREIVREADAFANTHPEHPDAIEHKRQHD